MEDMISSMVASPALWKFLTSTEKSVSLFNLRNLENVLQRNLRIGTARECIFRASGGTRFKKVTYSGRLGAQYTGLGAQILAPKKGFLTFIWRFFLNTQRRVFRYSIYVI